LQNLSCFCNFATDVAKYAKNYFCADEECMMEIPKHIIKMIGKDYGVEWNRGDTEEEYLKKILIELNWKYYSRQ
jgi:hypothetical protein